MKKSELIIEEFLQMKQEQFMLHMKKDQLIIEIEKLRRKFNELYALPSPDQLVHFTKSELKKIYNEIKDFDPKLGVVCYNILTFYNKFIDDWDDAYTPIYFNNSLRDLIKFDYFNDFVLDSNLNLVTKTELIEQLKLKLLGEKK